MTDPADSLEIYSTKEGDAMIDVLKTVLSDMMKVHINLTNKADPKRALMIIQGIETGLFRYEIAMTYPDLTVNVFLASTEYPEKDPHFLFQIIDRKPERQLN